MIQDEFVLEERDDSRLVANRLPPRPRLRIETWDGKLIYDLIPAIKFGKAVPDVWVLPAEGAFVEGWKVRHETTEVLRERMEARGLRVRVLKD